MERFDAHTHVFPRHMIEAREELCARDPTFREIYENPEAKLAGARELVATLEVQGFGGALAAGFAFAAERDITAQTEHFLEQPPVPSLVVAAPANPALPGLEAHLRRAREGGAVAAGELRPHNQGWDPLGAEGRRLCAIAQDLGLALLWHVSEPVGHAYPGKAGGITPAELIEVAMAFPALPMVGAHLGGGASFYLQMPEVREKTPLLFFDTAAAFLLYDEQCVRRLVDLVGPGRVLFASDYPLLSPRRQLEKTLAHLPADVAKAVGGGNATSLYLERLTT